MIQRLIVLFGLLGSFQLGALVWAEPPLPELVVYTYDSFVAPGGLGSTIFPLFEKKFGCRVRALGSGDGGQILTRLELDAQRKKPTAHLVIGLDQQIWEKAQPWIENWGSWTPAGYSELTNESKIGKGFLPYDYGVLAFMADHQALTEMKLKPPSSLSELLKPEWKRNIILEDPRTSTPGLMFLLYSQASLGSLTWDFWKTFRNQWLTLAPGWDAAYGLFLRKEAPLVWSYLTSQAYHEEHGDTGAGASKRRYEAILFKEGQPFQVEGAALIQGSIKSEQERKLAKNFLEFLISSEVQTLIPKKNWMIPARKNIDLPPSFSKLPKPSKLISISAHAKEIEEVLSRWSRVVEK